MALHKEKSYLDTAYNFRVNSDEMAQFKALCDEIPCPVSRGLNEYLAFAIKSKVLISSKDLGIVNYDGSITMANNLPVPSMPTVPSVPSDPTAPKLNKTFDHIDHSYELIERVILTINGKPCPYWVGVKSDKSGSESAFFTPEIEIIEIQDGLDSPENIGNKSISLVAVDNTKDSDKSLVSPDDIGNNDNSLDNPDNTSEGSNNQDGKISQLETPSNLNNTGLSKETLDWYNAILERYGEMLDLTNNTELSQKLLIWCGETLERYGAILDRLESIKQDTFTPYIDNLEYADLIENGSGYNWKSFPQNVKDNTYLKVDIARAGLEVVGETESGEKIVKFDRRYLIPNLARVRRGKGKK